jgi:hypothetical protein
LGCEFGFFEIPVLVALIDFKWESHVKKKFLKHLCLDSILVASFSVDALTQTTTHPTPTCFFVRHEQHGT